MHFFRYLPIIAFITIALPRPIRIFSTFNSDRRWDRRRTEFQAKQHIAEYVREEFIATASVHLTVLIRVGHRAHIQGRAHANHSSGNDRDLLMEAPNTRHRFMRHVAKNPQRNRTRANNAAMLAQCLGARVCWESRLARYKCFILSIVSVVQTISGCHASIQVSTWTESRPFVNVPL